MTIKFNRYEVGIAPHSGTTSTTTFCYTTTTTTSSSPRSTTTTSSFYNNLRQGFPHQQEYNGFSSLHVVQSRARCRTPPAQPLVTCPGERGLPSIGVLGATAISNSSRMEVDSGKTMVNQKMETWPECFQDLRSWCPPDRDELNTPQITMQDEFNFSPDGQVNCNNWNFVVENHPVEFSDSWVTNDLHLASPNNDEENNNYPVEFISGHNTSFVKTDMLENVDKSADYNGLVGGGAANSNVLKTKGNILLSQATLEPEDNPTYGEGMVFTDYIKLNSSSQAAATRLGSGGKIIKFEESEEILLPIVETVHTTLPVIQHQQQNVGAQRVLTMDDKRPRLKLTIPQTPQTTTNESTSSLSTPEVLKPLTDIPTSPDFDLLNFVFKGSTGGGKSLQNMKKNDTSTVQEYDCMDTKILNDIYIKAEPLSPQPAIGVKRHFPDESDLDSDDPSNVIDDDDSESEEWSPEGKRSKKPTGKRRGRKPSSVDSLDGQDKYRALRDRNNEASRRSRLNRKQRDMDMKKQESDLARRNRELKTKANRMEKLVEDMREAVFKSVINSRKRLS